MVDRNTVIDLDDRSLRAAETRDVRQTDKIYHFQNCGTIYIDSFNARGVRMKNCGNNIPQVTYHRPERVLHSTSPGLSNGPQNAMGPPAAPTVLTEIAKGSSSNVHLPMNALSPLQSPQLISQLHISGDHTLHDIKHLEQLLDSSLVAVAAIQSSGSTLEDVLTPRAYNTFKALYALAPLVTASSSTKPNRSEIPTRSTFSDMGNDYPNSSNGSPLLPNSSLGVPRTGLAVVACLVLVCLGYAKESP